NVIIDGTTQPGYAGVPLIEVQGNNRHNTGFHLSWAHSIIRGLNINNFSSGILVDSSHIVIEGNYIGTDLSGAAAPNPNTIGVNFYGTFHTCLVGGLTPQARNVISGNRVGIAMQAFKKVFTIGKVLVEGNYLGTDASGTLPLGNELYD